MKPKESKVHQKQIKIKINIRNILPWTIILYGIIGIIASTASIIFLNYQDIDIIDNSISQEFRDMSQYMKDASTSAKNAGNTLRQGEQVIYGASSATNYAKDTTYNIGNIINKITFWSNNPPFRELGDNFRDLTYNLNNLGRNLNQNAQDMDMMSKNLEEVSRKMQDISLKVDGNQISQNISKTGWIIYTLLITHFFMFILIGFAIRK